MTEGKLPERGQQSFLQQTLAEMLDPRQPLYRLAQHIPWAHLEEFFRGSYSRKGRPSHPIRLMVGLLILKHVENLSDEVVVERWRRDPYYQFFCGMVHFTWEPPCHPTDLVLFRKRIGSDGVEEILKVSVTMQGKRESEVGVVVMDTTVQEKNTMYPSDVRLYERVLRTLWAMAKREGIALRRTYRKELRHLVMGLRTRNFPRAKRRARKLARRLKTIARAVLNDFWRKCSQTQRTSHAESIATMRRILNQRPKDRNKVFSLHEPQIYCMARGKDRQMWEFGTKVSVAVNRHGVIVGAMNSARNAYDGHLVDEQLEQVYRLTGQDPQVVVGDQGYRGAIVSGDTMVVTPAILKKKRIDGIERGWVRKLCRLRSSIEPILGHLKSDHRMGRNYLKGWYGDEINVMLAAAGWNFRRLLRKLCALLEGGVWGVWYLLMGLIGVLRTGRVTVMRSLNRLELAV